MKNAADCTSLNDIRHEIDRIDYEIITKLSERMSYVKAAAVFKPDIESIPAPDRVDAMLLSRSKWATQWNLEPEFITKTFSTIIQWFINQQITHWKKTRQ